MNTRDNSNEELRKKIEEIVAKHGAEIVEYKLYFYAGSYSLRCLVDYENGGITVDTCALLNREISNFLEQSKLLGEDFIVEVNSPGIDRALKSYKDFLRLKNNLVGVWLSEAVEGKTFLEGELIDVSQNHISLKVKDTIYTIEFSKIKTGKVKL